MISFTQLEIHSCVFGLAISSTPQELIAQNAEDGVNVPHPAIRHWPLGFLSPPLFWKFHFDSVQAPCLPLVIFFAYKPSQLIFLFYNF